ncbi:MAG: hypothetical protein AB2637_12515 [Candidatus Thiodiazotropha sp.]
MRVTDQPAGQRTAAGLGVPHAEHKPMGRSARHRAGQPGDGARNRGKSLGSAKIFNLAEGGCTILVHGSFHGTGVSADLLSDRCLVG